MQKKNAVFATIVAATAALASPAEAGAVLDRILAKKELVAAADTATPTTSFLNDKNELDGFDIDVTNALAKRLGVKVRFVTPGWDVITAGRWSGRWDVSIASMTPTVERRKVLDFPVVYYAAPAALAVHKDNTAIKAAPDAGGKRVGVQGGSTYESYVNGTLKIDADGAAPISFQIKDARVTSYDTEGLSLDDLRLGDGKRLDAVVASAQAIDGAIRAGYPIRKVGAPLFYESLAIATDKGDPDLGARLTKEIEAMRADGTLKTLSEKWFKDDYSAVTATR